MKLIIIYSFERQGFNAKISECGLSCEHSKLYPEISFKPTTHAVAVLESLNLFNESLELIDPSQWFNRFRDVMERRNWKYNKTHFNEENLKSFLTFHNHYSDKLRNKIKNGNLHEAFNLLNKIKGVGSKVAKFIIRDLIFYLNNGNIDNLPKEDIPFAVPIDRWVRRKFLQIPSLFETFRKALIPEDFENEAAIDTKISKLIVRVCVQNNLNPLYFDFGCYWTGVNAELYENS